jgi:hypothetical protein
MDMHGVETGAEPFDPHYDPDTVTDLDERRHTDRLTILVLEFGGRSLARAG